MAKLEKPQQTAFCVSVRSVTFADRSGKQKTKEVYTLSLDGNSDPRHFFEVFESQFFKAKEGDVFIPVLVVDSRAYNDKKTNEARKRNEVFVNWEKVG